MEQNKPCTNDCSHCTRRMDKFALTKTGAVGIQPKRFIKFIRQFRGEDKRVAEFALAGNSTEPLLYPNIEEVIREIKESPEFGIGALGESLKSETSSHVQAKTAGWFCDHFSYTESARRVLN